MFFNKGLLESVFEGDIFDNKILPKLSVENIYDMSLSTEYFKKRFDKNYVLGVIKKRIELELRNIFKEHYDEFVETMQKSHAIISGSFLLQIILEEKWENSDIDIYVGSTCENNSGLRDNFFKDKLKSNEFHGWNVKLNNSITKKEASKAIMYSFLKKVSPFYRRGYNRFYHEFTDIYDIFNFMVDTSVISNVCQDMSNNYDGEFDRKLQEKPNSAKVQVIEVGTGEKKSGKSGKKSHTLIDHNNNTGFDICKNILYYDCNGNMQLRFTNLEGILRKQITFTLLGINDFFYRIEKYSNRNFHFRTKYNKILYLEYILFHFDGEHTLNTNFKESEYNSSSIKLNNNL